MTELDDHTAALLLSEHKYTKLDILADLLKLDGDKSHNITDVEHADGGGNYPGAGFSQGSEEETTQPINSITSRSTDEQITSHLDSLVDIDTLETYLDDEGTDFTSFILDSKAMKHYEGLDIRSKESRNSCCFTKR